MNDTNEWHKWVTQNEWHKHENTYTIFFLVSFVILAFCFTENYTRLRWMLGSSILPSPSIKRLLTKQELIARLCFSEESTVLRRNTLVLHLGVVYEFTLCAELVTQIQKRRKLESSFDILMPSVALNIFSMHNECFYTLITPLIRVLQRMPFLLMFRRILKL